MAERKDSKNQGYVRLERSWPLGAPFTVNMTVLVEGQGPPGPELKSCGSTWSLGSSASGGVYSYFRPTSSPGPWFRVFVAGQASNLAPHESCRMVMSSQ